MGLTNEISPEPRASTRMRSRLAAISMSLLVVVLAPMGRASTLAGPSPIPAAIPSRIVADLHLGDAGGGWDYATVDAAGGRLLVARMAGVDTVNLATNRAGPVLTSGRHVHSVLPVPYHRLLLTNGDDNTATIVDDESGLLLDTLKTGSKPDGAVLDRATGQVLVMNGKSGSITRIDVGRSSHVAGTIQVGGALEAPVLDGSGRLFVNVEDRNEIAVIGLSEGAVVARYKLAGCEGPTGLAYVASHRVLVSVCSNGVAEIVGDDGVERARLAVGPHPDAVIVDRVHDRVFIPGGGNGTLSEISFAGGPHVSRVFSTRPGARTGAYDPKTQYVYLPYGRMDRTTGTPTLVPGSFGVLVVDTH
ncbi:YncE family protein [Lichenicola cladoniae]|uniref:YncE family protein n=1 Tax=Lichenicola cladoniae TaxID=1484109 RepID=A0A6M8GY86_9PROT|nr:YncE family protein [Lichenicola cladoniae]NPD65184.1 YncE family protein [Acetobacteraceae bacterium]QKE88784.1 YncE family protein [Lichenicola cladoniae]